MRILDDCALFKPKTFFFYVENQNSYIIAFMKNSIILSTGVEYSACGIN